ncbi:MAG: hypothetical protein WC728_03695 [Elusimicrobiota bacterium]
MKKGIRRISWERLTRIYMDTRRPKVKAMIQKEARRCGYRMRGLVMAHVLRHFENAGGR